MLFRSLADQLADALAIYTQAGGTGDAVKQVQDEAVPLRKLLNDQIRITERTNLVQSRNFRQALEDAMLRYTNPLVMPGTNWANWATTNWASLRDALLPRSLPLFGVAALEAQTQSELHLPWADGRAADNAG